MSDIDLKATWEAAGYAIPTDADGYLILHPEPVYEYIDECTTIDENPTVSQEDATPVAKQPKNKPLYSKLTETDWINVEWDMRSGKYTTRELAEKYNVTYKTIYNRKRTERRKKSREVDPATALRNNEVIFRHQRALDKLHRLCDIFVDDISRHINPDEQQRQLSALIGERESPSDMLVKIARAIKTGIELETKIYNLDAANNPAVDSLTGLLNSIDGTCYQIKDQVISTQDEDVSVEQ